MSAPPRPIGEYLEVGRRFKRSINIEKDYGAGRENGDYIVTPTALETLNRLAEGFEKGSPSRAWTITGPYGVGKSAFAVFLTRLLCSTDEQGGEAREKLKRADPDLSRRLADPQIGHNGFKGLFPVLVTARRAPAPKCIAEGILTALQSADLSGLTAVEKNIGGRLEGPGNGISLDTRLVVGAANAAAQAALEAGYRGLLMIVDELGKLFEYAAKYPQRGDVFVLQELAEDFSRSDFPALFVGLLHQSFEEYGHHLDIGTRREWSKIQGRFGDVAFLEPAEQVVRLIAEAVKWSDACWPPGMKENVEAVISSAVAAGAAPPGMPSEEFRKAAISAYPLHPLTLVALPYVFRRFAQNERSLFSYLASSEPHGFQDFVKTRPMVASRPEFLRLSNLFDYFTSNFGLGLYRQPQALRWMEAADILDRKDGLSDVHRDVVKTVGVLNVLGHFCHLSASPGMIALSVEDAESPAPQLQQILSDLRGMSVLTYRSYNRSYRIWEGSDVDIDERIGEGERQTRNSLGLAENVRRSFPSRPMVARRHSFETGTLRSFDVHYVDSVDAVDDVLATERAMDGKIIVCLAESTALADQFHTRALQCRDSNVLLAIPQEIGELRGAVAELGALRWVWENTPELRDDRIARREISLRITEVEQLLQRNLKGLLDPRGEPYGSSCRWYHSGDLKAVKTPVEVSQALSDVCDCVFCRSPRIRNELVVRRSLSSAAAGARRNLIEAMLLRPNEPFLGIEGYPPERSMYESVLHATGIHREEVDGVWRFSRPFLGDKLSGCWEYLIDAVFNRQAGPIPLNDLFADLSAAPYGLAGGLHPLLLCAFMVVHGNETTLYREGTFLPEPGVVDFEILMRRPELFAVAGSRVEGGRKAIIQRLATGLEVEPYTVPIVRSLFQRVKSLLDFAWNTQQLSAETLALRDAFNNARSPEKFLFVEVPTALGIPPFSEEETDLREIERFFAGLNKSLQEWATVSSRSLANVRDLLLEACGLPVGEGGWALLRRRCAQLESSVREPQLLSFVQRAAQAPIDQSGVESVCALLASRPLERWTDADVHRFQGISRALGKRFREVSNATATCRGVADLMPEERCRAEEILEALRQDLAKTAKRESTQVIRAALLKLLADLDSFVEQQKEVRS